LAFRLTVRPRIIISLQLLVAPCAASHGIMAYSIEHLAACIAAQLIAITSGITSRLPLKRTLYALLSAR